MKPKVVTTTVKDAKSDSSFFSAPKPKPKLPSFKKAPPVSSSTTTGSTMVKREPDGNVAQPSSIDPFQEVLKSMTKGRMGSPATSAPTAAANSAMDTSASNTPVADSISATDGPRKKRKTVTWAANGQLEQVRLIERAIYDDDPVDVGGFVEGIARVMIFDVIVHYRESTLRIVYETWKGGKVPHYTRIYLKN